MCIHIVFIICDVIKSQISEQDYFTTKNNCLSLPLNCC